MNLLALVPWWGRALMLAALASALIGFGYAKGSANAHEADQIVMDKHLLQDQHEAATRAAQAIAARDAAIRAQQAAQAETDRRLADQQEASRVHEKQLDQARADAAAADVSVKRLQHRIAQLAAVSGGGSAPSGNPASSAVSTPAAGVGIVAAESVERYAALAEAARRGQLAGNECSARYDALMHAPH